ncbi:hypothetical protein GQ42DRAFT_162180 [Ramicandelaber brevisporus]|nr:hypothetical protein GQ42DRAFT_162180 [Ramicandelaber brevisporus]
MLKQTLVATALLASSVLAAGPDCFWNAYCTGWGDNYGCYSCPIKVNLDARNCPQIAGCGVRLGDYYKAGQLIRITCQTTGDYYGGTNIWDRTEDGYYVPDAYVRTGTAGFLDGTRRC